jgi:hypothetical protein
MLLLAQSEIVLFLGDEEGFREADGIIGWMEGITSAAPSLGGEERVGVHCGVAQRIVHLMKLSCLDFDNFLSRASEFLAILAWLM